MVLVSLRTSLGWTRCSDRVGEEGTGWESVGREAAGEGREGDVHNCLGRLKRSLPSRAWPLWAHACLP